MSTLKVTTIRDLSNGTAVDVPNAAKAWVNFNGTGTIAIRASYNVTSLTDNGTGDYTVNLTNALTDTNYAVVATCGYGPSGFAANIYPFINNIGSEVVPSTSSFRFVTNNEADSAQIDSKYVMVAVFR